MQFVENISSHLFVKGATGATGTKGLTRIIMETKATDPGTTIGQVTTDRVIMDREVVASTGVMGAQGKITIITARVASTEAMVALDRITITMAQVAMGIIISMARTTTTTTAATENNQKGTSTLGATQMPRPTQTLGQARETEMT